MSCATGGALVTNFWKDSKRSLTCFFPIQNFVSRLDSIALDYWIGKGYLTRILSAIRIGAIAQTTLKRHYFISSKYKIMQGSWVERAEEEFGVPEGYFNLWPFREIGEEERFREIASSFQLGSYSSVRLVNGDTVEGVYESYAGLLEALKRNDVVMVEYFWSRLKPFQKEYLKEHSSLSGYPTIEEKNPYGLGEEVVRKGLAVPERLSTEVVYYIAERGYLPALRELERLYGHTENLLMTAIISGNVTFLDSILPSYFSLRDGVSVANIPILPFDAERTSFPLYNVTFGQTDKSRKLIQERSYVLLGNAVRSCNVQIVDFFRSLCGVDVLPERSVIYLTQTHRRPVDAFCILQRTDLQRVDFRYDGIWDHGDINLILYILLKKDVKKLPERIIESNLGNIPLLVTLLNLYPNYVPPLKLEDIEMYPLSRSILYQ